MIEKMIKNLENRMEKMEESINKDLGELKNKYTDKQHNYWNKNTLEGNNSRISEAEGQISELEGKILETTAEEQTKVKRMKRTEDRLRDHWHNIKCTNIWIIGVPEEERKRKCVRKFLKT